MKSRKRQRKIGWRVNLLLLASVSCAVLLTGGVGVYSIFQVNRLAAQTSRELGRTAAQDAETALKAQAEVQLCNLAVEKAAAINERFAAVEAYVHGIAALAEDIYANPQAYPDRSVPLPERDSHELAAQLLWSSRLAGAQAQQREELLKLGNVQDLLVQYNAWNHMVSSAYLATKSGWMLQADYIAYSKYTGDSQEPDFYEAEDRQWYQRALLTGMGETVYSDVLTDVHEGKECIVCSQPVYLNGEIVAVAGVGSYLETVEEAVLNTFVGESGYAFLVNKSGRVVISPKTEGETAEYADEDVDLRKSGNASLAEAADDMTAGNVGMEWMKLDGKEVCLAYAPLSALGWSFVTVMDREEVIAPARESQETILALTEEVAGRQEAAIQRMFLVLFCLIPASFLLVGVWGTAFSRRITAPIRMLTADVAKLSGGSLDTRIQIATGDEVEDLGNAFNAMTVKLQEYIQNLSTVTAEKERIRTELKVAAGLQADMLPDPETVLKERGEFILHASMTPAKEVGGDFYDFFLLDENRLALVVADVSGKGVPAALFMVVSRTLIRSCLSGGKSLARAVTEVNNILCRENKDGMFVTAWLGVLYLTTGRLTYVNAGHCHPLVRQEGGFRYLTSLGGLMLAGLEGSAYQESSILLKPGDLIFQYSDGVTEAHDETHNLYGEERLRIRLNRNRTAGPQKLVEAVWQDLEGYRGGAEQFDDITMLAVCYMGPESKNRMAGRAEKPGESGKAEQAEKPEEAGILGAGKPSGEFARTSKVEKPEDPAAGHVRRKNYPASKGQSRFRYKPESGSLSELTSRIEKRLNKELPRESLSEVLMSVDEIFSNICRYSGASWVEVTCNMLKDEAVLCFEDDGIPYNPLEKTDPDVTARLEERKAGGLGIYLVKKMMDRVTYEYRDGKNCLTIIKKRTHMERRRT